MMRSRLIMGIAAVTAVAAGGVGGALIGVPGLSSAQPFPNSATTAAAEGANASNPPGSPLLDAAAKALNLTTQQLRDKLSDAKTTIADVAKQQHVDINTVINAMTGADKDRITNIVNNPWPKFGARRGPGNTNGPFAGPAARGGLGFGLGRLGAVALDPVAQALGITTDELKTDLGKGQSIADIAKAKHVDINTVINTLVADATKRIDQAVTDGHLGQAQADKLKAALKTMITDAVNGTFPKGPMAGGFGGFGGRRHGFGGPGAPPMGAPTPPTTKAPTA